MTLACNFCAKVVCPEGLSEDETWRKLCMHIWLEHPECITKEGKIVHMYVSPLNSISLHRVDNG